MICLDCDRKFAFTDEVHEGLFIILVLLILVDIFVSEDLPVGCGFIFLLQIFHIRTSEYAFELDH